ncbi:MAG: hypothetical protein ACRCXL_03680 [Dermatophilaceae bacterium]
MRFVVTSATSDARNVGEFVDGMREAFGDFNVVPEVASGAEEAGLAVTGATGGLAAVGVAGPHLVVDIGGGYSELVRGTTAVEAARSVDIGSVRMTKRHLRTDPPTDDEIDAARADVAAGLEEVVAAAPLAGVATVVGLAGSITTVTAHAIRLDRYDARPPPRRSLGADPPCGGGVTAADDARRPRRAAVPASGPSRRHRRRRPRLGRRARPGGRALAGRGGRDERARHPRRHRPRGCPA